ncbi:alkaline phosphatase family protein [Parasphingorhabdus cellanae]|uniref:alkaline phosphatase family protein n=1 Tax=Parasphingorhabdus cellanae TaxID=2806553 RepID=UPI001FB105AB|nr:alkaline phosphatase family protein [Parasphingorhabdus cellanae]
MRVIKYVTSFIAFIAISGAANAEHHSQTQSGKPKLVIAISVDQFSSDLFSEYRSSFTGGLKRLASGAVFPSGYQGHAATETCPGHATIMTGVHPGRAGIIANNWIDLGVKREDKTIYCAEDPRIEGTSFGSITAATQGDYVASAWHLLVPTLGERLKTLSPGSRNMAVSGKDRAALMMGGNAPDMIFWWKGEGFKTKKDGLMLPALPKFNTELKAMLAKPRAPIAVPAHCEARNRAIPLGGDSAVGTYQFQRPKNGASIFRASPDFDAAVLALAEKMVKNERLGAFEFTDILNIGLSATDYVGHAFGTGGVEMCINLSELDRNLGSFFDKLDEMGRDYMVVLTADHGGHDLPERLKQQGVPEAQRIDDDVNADGLNEVFYENDELRKYGQIIYADSPFGDYYVSQALPAPLRAEVKAEAMAIMARNRQVELVLDGADLAKMPMPSGPVEEWSLTERARASFHPDRSGDFIVLLKKGVTPIDRPMRGYVSTHGSPWDYDRRVPILFWRKGMTHFEQPLSVQTVDIAPTLASIIGLDIPDDELDGRCLDIDGGPGDNCR